ncbi:MULTISPECIES: response regulator transcription factor [unclassified Bacillus (in: firmicutes)]|uniref:response regulator transcription factor n=1 Tax=unclassified Bacillus (in: firmicutes) TaxID=185979 RepID=UPI0008EA7480|nr:MULTISPECIES: response regulator transcription factor [unclassified Bacillus (in: firmicutes)]SFB06519.1 DNA-binding response regulator, OmpR family, contains REC and winged-helix (wHTH) domain [Bacillus sp. UNCCL13]SFQ87654.1 DNA-binding response regulator, OmpR family, contains REC and winged-helix (wHTH) domain [Bacillus sp. cl95]
MLKNEAVSGKKILLVDDEAEILELLSTVLKKEGFDQIVCASKGADAVSKCELEKPDIVVLDIMLPDMDGYEVCKKMREFTLIPIIFLSAKTDDIDKLLGLGIGGDDYVTKPFSPKEIAFRIKAQFRRNEYLSQYKKRENSTIAFGEVIIDTTAGEVIKSGIPVILTAKEYQLLVYLAEHPNQILSKSKICDAVWGEDYIGHDNTIMVHIRHLREKLEENPSKPKWILTVKGLGYKLQTRSHST